MGDDNAITPLLTPEEVGKILKVDRRTVVRLCCSGRLPAVNVATGVRNGRWRISVEDLREFLSKKSDPPRPVPVTPKLPPHIRDLASDFMMPSPAHARQKLPPHIRNIAAKYMRPEQTPVQAGKRAKLPPHVQNPMDD